MDYLTVVFFAFMWACCLKMVTVVGGVGCGGVVTGAAS